MLFAEGITQEGGVIGACALIATGVFAWLKRRETRRIREIEAESKKAKEDTAELWQKVDTQRKVIADQGGEMAKMKKEIEQCHAERDMQNGTINRLEEWRIESLSRQNELYRRVEELEQELERHRPQRGHRK